MTAAKTRSQLGRMSRNKGAQAERDVVAYLRTVGFGGAERAVRTGYRTKDRTAADPGDITGTPGIIWSVKDCAVERLDQWQDELDAMAVLDPNPETMSLLVHKRRGHASPAEWWCWISVCELSRLLGARFYGPQWFRTTLGELIPLLCHAGYGDSTEETA